MRLYTFEMAGRRSVGVEKNNKLTDIGDKVGGDMLSFLRGGDKNMKVASDLAGASGTRSYRFHEVKLLAPIPRPGKILCAALNYRTHLEENPEATLPEEPTFFAKLGSCVIGTGEPILHPGKEHKVDFEVELAAVIGKPIKRNTPENQIKAAIAGFTILHDVSARQHRDLRRVRRAGDLQAHHAGEREGDAAGDGARLDFPAAEADRVTGEGDEP
jgi:2-keto-4-pentenoate hydratase/2-oxohepta-3-ene-1,7-dioic acid hydratase in catechol pathway